MHQQSSMDLLWFIFFNLKEILYPTNLSFLQKKIRSLKSIKFIILHFFDFDVTDGVYCNCVYSDGILSSIGGVCNLID